MTSEFFTDDRKFLHGIDGKPNADRMNHFRGALERTRQLARQQLAKNPRNTDALFGLTLAAGMESNADVLLDKKRLDGVKHVKEAKEYAKTLLADHPEVFDAYLALGAANYVVGSLGAGSRFVLWFDGVHGDKELGMSQMEQTATHGRYLKPFAKVMLALAENAAKSKIFSRSNCCAN